MILTHINKLYKKRVNDFVERYVHAHIIYQIAKK
jgi:hypothetical protein